MSLHESVSAFLAKQRDYVLAVRRHALHPRFNLKRANYKEGVEGSQITIAGAVVNLLLSIFKAIAGIYGNSAALVADAAHSFSDLISDGLTLVVLRMGSLPPDHDHPYGHGRFEALGSLGIGFLLVTTGLSFGSYAIESIHTPSPTGPRKIALVAAAVSVLSKEILFRATRRVGQRLNSNVLIANAWHHRSDALSSVVAIFGVGGAILGWRVLDPLCGLCVAALVGWMGLQIMMEAITQLSDTADEESISEIRAAAASVDGVLKVEGVRCRYMSSNVAMADMSVFIGPHTTASSAQRLSTLVRSAVLEANPKIKEVLVHTQTMCPLLSASAPAVPSVAVEVQVENNLLSLPPIHSVPSVQVRYINGGELAVDVDVDIAQDLPFGGMAVSDLRNFAAEARTKLLSEVEDLKHVSISCRLI